MRPIALISLRQFLRQPYEFPVFLGASGPARKFSQVKAGLCLAAALAMGAGAVLVPSQAAASGRHHYGVSYHYGGHYKHGGYSKYSGYRGAKGHYGYGHHHKGHYRKGRHKGHYKHGGLSGAEAALIAAGIIGGVILIDQAIENSKAPKPYYGAYGYNGRDRYYRQYRPYYGAYDYGTYGDAPISDGDWGAVDEERLALAEERRKLAEERRKLNEERRRLENARTGRGTKGTSPSRGRADDALDDLLLGGEETASQGANPLLRRAFAACSAETRLAANTGQVMVALPSAPNAVEALPGGAYRLTADFTAQQTNGVQLRRTMQCDADDKGILRLEIL